jgi:eukaryotic-like serine/threonine-protein kinase
VDTPFADLLFDDEIDREVIVREAEARLFGGAAVPVRVGRFEVKKRIGVGGLGVVYEAHDPELDRSVALKLLRAGGSSARDRSLEGVRREARAMARLTHPNVVRIYEVGEHRGRGFVAMELVAGPTLREFSRRRDVTIDEVLRALEAAGQGLFAAHQKGLVHRDFKPENVLVDGDGIARVTDFGLALDSDDATGAIGGTPAYMAPEQHRRERATAETDQFAFAVTAFEMLYGMRPFSGETEAELARAKEHARMIDVPLHLPVPKRIARALERALRPERSARWPSMNELLIALAHDPGARVRRVAGLVVVAVAIAVALVAAFLQFWMFRAFVGGGRR